MERVRRNRLVYLLACALIIFLSVGSVTLVNLTFQVVGILGVSNGGTGRSAALSGSSVGEPQINAGTNIFSGWGRTLVVDGTTTTALPSTPSSATRYLVTGDLTQAAAITVSNADVTVECTPGSKLTRSTATDLFDVTGARFRLLNCTVDGSSLSTAGTGPLVTIGNATTAANDALIQGNTFQNTGQTASFTGTILIQNGLRTVFDHNTFSTTQTDYCVNEQPIAAKSTVDTVISWNKVTTFAATAASTSCITISDGNGSGATVTGSHVVHNTLYGSSSSDSIIRSQGTSISQSASSPRNMEISFNNIYLTGSTTQAVKIFTFLTSRFIGNIIDDQGNVSQNLVSLGDTYNSVFYGNELHAAGNQNAVWNSADEGGNTTTGNTIYGVAAAKPGFEWVSTSGVLANNNVTANAVYLLNANASFCYQIVTTTTSFNSDGNIFSSNNCLGTGTSGQEGLDVQVGTTSGAGQLLNTNILGNDFVNVDVGIRVWAQAQTGTGPATIRTVNIGNNSFETVTTAIKINPSNSSGGGATNVSGVFIDGNSFRSVTTAYSATPGTGNSISGTVIGQQSYDSVTNIYSDTGTGTSIVLNSFTALSTTVLNPAATTDTKLAEFPLSAGYLNNASKVFELYAKIIHSTGTSQTPTVTYKIKLCTVSGCGSGTALTLLTFGASGAMTASTTETGIITARLATSATGASGTMESSGWAIINVSSGNAAATGGTLFNDTNNALSSTIDLTAALFVDVMGQFSTQSGTKNGMVARIATFKPVN